MEEEIINFWNNVEKTDDCWLWVGETNIKGYGKVFYKKMLFSSHKLSWFLHYNRWPEKLICHHCDIPQCVNPAHLFEGTQKDNMQDASKKGRLQRKNNKNKDLCKITFNKRKILLAINKCNFKTSPKEIAGLLERLFIKCIYTEGHWLYIAENWTPRTITRVLRHIEKQYKWGRDIKNPAAYFTYLIKFRKRRKFPKVEK